MIRVKKRNRSKKMEPLLFKGTARELWKRGNIEDGFM